MLGLGAHRDIEVEVRGWAVRVAIGHAQRVCHAHLCDEMRVFAKRLFGTPKPRVGRHLQLGTECTGHATCAESVIEEGWR